MTFLKSPSTIPLLALFALFLCARPSSALHCYQGVHYLNATMNLTVNDCPMMSATCTKMVDFRTSLVTRACSTTNCTVSFGGMDGIVSHGLADQPGEQLPAVNNSPLREQHPEQCGNSNHNLLLLLRRCLQFGTTPSNAADVAGQIADCSFQCDNSNDAGHSPH